MPSTGSSCISVHSSNHVLSHPISTIVGVTYSVPFVAVLLCISMRLRLRIEHLHIVPSTHHDDPHRFGWGSSPATEEL